MQFLYRKTTLTYFSTTMRVQKVRIAPVKGSRVHEHKDKT